MKRLSESRGAMPAVDVWILVGERVADNLSVRVDVRLGRKTDLVFGLVCFPLKERLK